MIRILVVGIFLVGAACGGTPRNAALKNRVSEARLAPVSVAGRSQEAETHQAVFLAEWQQAFTKNQLKGAELEVKIAKNNLASAKLGVKSANLEKKAADESGDMNRVKEATHQALLAENKSKMHSISIDRAKKSMSYLKKRLIYEDSLFRKFEAKLEVARAESLSAAGIVPPDFKLKTYKSQYSERLAKSKTYKSAVDAAYKELKSLDAQLTKAKSSGAATKSSGAGFYTAPAVKLIPDLPSAQPVGTPAPTNPKPLEPPASDLTAPTSDTPAPTTEPTSPAPADPKPSPEASTVEAAPATGDQP